MPTMGTSPSVCHTTLACIFKHAGIARGARHHHDKYMCLHGVKDHAMPGP